MDDIGYYVMIGLLVAGAGYGLANRDKPKPPLSKNRRNIAVICFGIAAVCAVLLLAMVLLVHAPAHQ
jgi:hypothetical protein